MPVFLRVLLLSVALFVLGQVAFTGLFEFFEPKIEGILFQVPGPFSRTSLLFSFVLACIPVLLLSIWRFAPIISSTKKIASLVTVFIFMAIGILLRRQSVKIYFIKVVKPVVAPNSNMHVLYPIDPIRFVYYIIAGLCIGCIVSYFLFRQKEA